MHTIHNNTFFLGSVVGVASAGVGVASWMVGVVIQSSSSSPNKSELLVFGLLFVAFTDGFSIGGAVDTNMVCVV